MKLFERVTEHRFRKVAVAIKNQFSFMPERLTTKAIFLLWQIMEIYRLQKDLHMVFIDMEKAYDKIPITVMWLALEIHKVPTKYIALIREIQDTIVNRSRRVVRLIPSQSR
jgi:hypothetical protein